jgi:uncharacterized protein (DUF1697 family)
VDTASQFTVLAARPEAGKVEELARLDFAPDKVVVTDWAAYVYAADRYGVTKLSNNYLERKLGVAATTRNYNTTSKLVELSAEPSGRG